MVDLSAGNAIRLGSGLLFAALGAAVLVVGRRRVGALAFGAQLFAAGTWIVAVNSTEVDPQASTALAVLMWCLGLTASFLLPAPLSRRQWPVLAVALAVPVFSTVMLSGQPGALIGSLDVVNWTLTLMTLLLPPLRLAMIERVDRRRVAQAAGLSLPGALWVGSGLLAGVPLSISAFAGVFLVVLAVAVAWIIAAARGGGRLAVAIAWAFLGTALLGYAIGTFGQVVVGQDPYGFTGIARILGWTAAAIAILRADLLGVPLPRVAVKRGTITTAVVACFFIAAEVAQNFLSDEYGLVMGGVIAGAVLFAARPLERAFEGWRTVPVAAPPGGRVVPAASAEAYRAAVRAALVDGVMTPSKEDHLAEVAEHLGLGPRDAVRIRHEIEEEVLR